MYHEYKQFLQRGISIDIYELSANARHSSGGSTFICSSPSLDSSLDEIYQNSKVTKLQNINRTSSNLNGNGNGLQQLSNGKTHVVETNNEEVEEDEDGSEVELECVQLARAHWIQLHRLNVQTSAVQQMFIYMFKHYKQMRPIWQFARCIDDSNELWANDLLNTTHFRHHCTSFQAAVTLIMDNLDDYGGLSKLLQELGAHHFFYDCFEAHLELIHEAFMESLKELLKGTSEALDDQLTLAWDQLWKKIKLNMSYGISIQRHIYLAQCITPAEMKTVREMWEKVRQSRDLISCGEEVAATALKEYEELVNKYKIGELKGDLSSLSEHNGEVFIKFAAEIIKCLDQTIAFYSPEHGFANLMGELKGFAQHLLIIDVCPSLVRKAFMHGLISMLGSVLGETTMNENAMHSWTWSKIYRVIEQAIIANIVEY